MSDKCDFCQKDSGIGPATLRMNGLVMCDSCAYDDSNEKQIASLIATALNEFTIGGGTRREFVDAVLSVNKSIIKIIKK